MSKSQISQNSKCPFCQDIPTKVAHLGWRFFYTLVAFLILGFGIIPGNSFFISLTLFVSALFMDYLRFIPDTTKRKIIRAAGIFINGFWLIIGIIGIAGIVSVVKDGEILLTVLSKNFIVTNKASVALEKIWYTLGISVFLTAVDWLVYDSPFEKNMLQQHYPDQKQSI